MNAKIVSLMFMMLLWPFQVTYKPKVDAAANQTKPVCFAQTRQGSVSVHPASVNRFLGVNGWMLYHEKVCISQHKLSVLVKSTLEPLVGYLCTRKGKWPNKRTAHIRAHLYWIESDIDITGNPIFCLH